MKATFENALACHRAGHPADAVALCRTLLEALPGHPAVLNLLGLSLHALGQPAAAIAALEQALRTQPDFTSAVLNLAIVQQEGGRSEEAALRFRQVLVLQPDLLPGMSRLGTLLQEQGDLAGAVRLLERAARLVPLGELEQFNLAMARLANGEIAAAAQALRQMLAIRPEAGLAWSQLGEMRLRQGRPDQATPMFERAFRLNPADGTAANGRARCRRYHALTGSFHAGAVPQGLAIRGPFATTSGYAHMARRFIQTLRADGLPIHLMGIFGGERWSGEVLEQPVRAQAVLNFLIPLVVEPVPGLPTVTFSMFEGTRIPPAWARLSASSDLVIVPAESSRIAWAAQGFPEERLRVCPLGVDPEPGEVPPLQLLDEQGRVLSERRHRFLNVSDFIPRKNLDGLLRVWLRSTHADDDAVLILKPGKGGNPQKSAELQELIRATEAAVGKRMQEAAPVLVIDRTLSEIEMTALFRTATCYWSLSHGEGWDLPLSKAGAMGLGLIAPRHSAYVDYLDDSVARMIPSRVGPALRPYSPTPWPPFFGLDWWNPDEDAAAAIISGIIRGHDAPLPDARRHLMERFTWRQAAGRLRAILDEASAPWNRRTA